MTNLLKAPPDLNLSSLSAYKFRYGIVVARWNAIVTNALLAGAKDFLIRKQVPEEKIKIVDVPGSFELTIGASMLLAIQSIDAIICLGCVIQGETRHFEYICQAVSYGLTQLIIQYNKPVIFGVLTTETVEQAMERSGGKHGNKGEEAAAAAVHMLSLKDKFKA